MTLDRLIDCLRRHQAAYPDAEVQIDDGFSIVPLFGVELTDDNDWIGRTTTPTAVITLVAGR